MVSSRCKMVVKEAFEKLGLQCVSISLGEVDVLETVSPAQLELLKAILLNAKLELIQDKKSILIESIKNTIVQMIHYDDDLPATTISGYISEKLHYNYTYLANIFSETQGTTIEHYIIKHRIEKVKELISYDELNLTEISYKMHYSSVSHLSHQFKKVTGLTPSFFKTMKNKNLMLLENV
jgi:AraC-like DNA-binding protein